MKDSIGGDISIIGTFTPPTKTNYLKWKSSLNKKDIPNLTVLE